MLPSSSRLKGSVRGAGFIKADKSCEAGACIRGSSSDVSDELSATGGLL